MNITTSASCSIAPDSRRSDRRGRWRSSALVSGARESWESARRGSRAPIASSLSERLMSEISCWRNRSGRGRASAAGSRPPAGRGHARPSIAAPWRASPSRRGRPCRRSRSSPPRESAWRAPRRIHSSLLCGPCGSCAESPFDWEPTILRKSLLARHLHAEDSDLLAVHEGSVLCNVQCEGGSSPWTAWPRG